MYLRSILLGFVVSLVVGGAYIKGRADGRAVVQAKWDEEKAQQYREFNDRVQKIREKERVSASRVAQIEQEKNDEIARINVAHLRIVDSLRNRPSRPDVSLSAVGSADLSPPAGGTGAGLYREDGEFLAGEASRADRVRSSLIACYSAYDAVSEGNR